jgi:hypothetical protein
MLDIIEKHRNKSPPQENEDVFVVLSMTTERKSIADASVASVFSLEVLCEDIAMHATVLSDWERFLKVQDDPPRRVYVIHKPYEVFKRLASSESSKTLTREQLDKTFVEFLL